ncbi:hypothetical protein [Thiofilum flexile]|uniref:hypothetical protein n=1 Tax=Thiofilum flexile TaxID=125627 RepID=UPI000372CEF7|nr:hypothetical protein [Thiofilum flexile]
MRLLIALVSLLSATAYADNTNATFGSTPPAESVTIVDSNSMPEPVLSATTVTTTTMPLGRTRTINISTPDRFGTIEESITPAIHSEARYVTRGGSGYVLVGSNQHRSNEHQNEQLMIPSWKVFSW